MATPVDPEFTKSLREIIKTEDPSWLKSLDDESDRLMVQFKTRIGVAAVTPTPLTKTIRMPTVMAGGSTAATGGDGNSSNTLTHASEEVVKTKTWREFKFAGIGDPDAAAKRIKDAAIQERLRKEAEKDEFYNNKEDCGIF